MYKCVEAYKFSCLLANIAKTCVYVCEWKIFFKRTDKNFLWFHVFHLMWMNEKMETTNVFVFFVFFFYFFIGWYLIVKNEKKMANMCEKKIQKFYFFFVFLQIFSSILSVGIWWKENESTRSYYNVLLFSFFSSFGFPFFFEQWDLTSFGCVT